ASTPNTEMRLTRTPRFESKVFPCHAKMLTNSAMSWLNTVPGAIIAVPFACPSGIEPAGLAPNRSSNWVALIFNKSGTSMLFSKSGGTAYGGAAYHKCEKKLTGHNEHKGARSGRSVAEIVTRPYAERNVNRNECTPMFPGAEHPGSQ